MTGLQGTVRVQAVHPELKFGFEASGDVLTIALVNNMPDSALRATERQFCALLGVASEGRLVKVQFFSLPGVNRSSAARKHIARYYQEFTELERSPPDGIIVTGTEPQAAMLQEEPYWPAMAWLVKWVREMEIPGVWSCLAAHAAVLQADRIQRHALGTKLHGLFECKIKAGAHRILHGLPDRWHVPHSRIYGLSESALNSSGYNVLSASAEAGPDIFVGRKGGLQLFFQGHPEYGHLSLLGEYRRDVGRFLRGERDAYPEIPRHYCEPAIASELENFRDRAFHVRDPATLAQFDTLTGGLVLENSWSNTAAQIYANWLSHLADLRSQCLLHSTSLTDRTRPIHLAA
jgi:homoserine O-succinyltransferase/O-acetyltransferase